MGGNTLPLPQFSRYVTLLSTWYDFMAWFLVEHSNNFNLLYGNRLERMRKSTKHSQFIINLVLWRLGIFLFATASSTTLGSTQHPIQWITGALFLEVKRPGCEANHLPPHREEVKTRGAIPQLPYVFIPWRLVKRPACTLLKSSVLKVTFEKKYDGVTKSFRTESTTK